eukprot:gene55758-30405_t
MPPGADKPWHELDADERRGPKRTMFGKSTAAFSQADNDALKEKVKPPPSHEFDRREWCQETREKARKGKEECITALGAKSDMKGAKGEFRAVYNFFINRIIDRKIGDVKAEVREERDADRDEMDELEITKAAAERLKAKRGYYTLAEIRAEAGKKGGWRKIEQDACEAGRNAQGKDGETQASIVDYSNDHLQARAPRDYLLYLKKAKGHDEKAKKEKEEKEKAKAKKNKENEEKEKEKAERKKRKEEREKEKDAAKAKTGGKDEKTASKEAEIGDHMLVAEVTCVVKGKLELCLRGGGNMCDRDLPADDFRVALLCPRVHGLAYISGGQDASFVCAECDRKTGGDGDVYACIRCTPDFALCPDCAESVLTKEKAKAKGEKKAEEKVKAQKEKEEKDKEKKKEEAEKRAKAEKEKKEKEEKRKKEKKEEAEKRAKAEKDNKEKEEKDKKKKKEEAEKRAKAEKEKKEKEEKDKKKEKEEAEKAKAEKGKKDKEKAEETCPLGHRLKTMTKADLKAEGHDATFQCDVCKEKPHNIVEATKRGAKVCVRADIDHDWGRCGKCAPEGQEAKPAAKAPEQGSLSAGHGKDASKQEKAPKGGKKKAQKGKTKA